MGQWSSSFMSLLGTKCRSGFIKLICFEPSAQTFSRLSEFYDDNQRADVEIRLEKLALSNASGGAQLKIVHEGAGVNSLVEVPNSFEKLETVSRISLDEYVQQQQIDVIDLLKIDAEGHDMDVMLGAEGLLSSGRIKVVQFEYNWRWIYGKRFLLDAFRLLRGHSYKLFKITPVGLLSLGEYEDHFQLA